MNEENNPDSTEDSTPPAPGVSSLNETAARVTDIALGIGATAVESLDRAARSLDHAVRHVVGNAPELLDELEVKGKPVRERLASLIANTPRPPQSPSQSATATTRPTDDIAVLEARVRELEAQQASTPSTTTTREPVSPYAEEPVFPASDPTQEPQIPVDNFVESNPSGNPDDTPSSNPDRVP
ncbi:MAG: hypothetical protein ACOVT5_10575 [Armatimonadaceae bacterium]